MLLVFCCQDAFRAFHNDLSNVKKYLTPIYKGDLRKGEYVVRDMDKDFREIRATAEKMVGLSSGGVGTVQIITVIQSCCP